MYGKDDDPELEETGTQSLAHKISESPAYRSLEFATSQDIYKLPEPHYDVQPIESQPALLQQHDGKTANVTDINSLLSNHRSHWKNVKKSWIEHGRKRDQRYSNSLEALRTAHRRIQAK